MYIIDLCENISSVQEFHSINWKSDIAQLNIEFKIKMDMWLSVESDNGERRRQITKDENLDQSLQRPCTNVTITVSLLRETPRKFFL